MHQRQGFSEAAELPTREVNEVTMLVLGCRDEVIIVLDPEKMKRGWSWPSAQVRDGKDPEEVAIEGVLDKIGFDARGREVTFLKEKVKNDIPFSSYFLELTTEEFDSIPSRGPRGHSVRRVSKEALGQYLDRGRYHMAVSRMTGIR